VMVVQAVGHLSEGHELLEASSSHFAEIRDSWSAINLLPCTGLLQPGDLFGGQGEFRGGQADPQLIG
jgi:hypothetical protein